MADLRIRSAVRAVLVTPDQSILLVRFEFPDKTVWALPGGGVDAGETRLEALHRELDEEVGLHDADVGPHIWTREHIIPFIDGQWDGQRDDFFLVPVGERFEPTPSLSWEQLRDERLHEIRWWTLSEINDATEAGTLFAPQRLGEVLSELDVTNPPTVPIETGV